MSALNFRSRKEHEPTSKTSAGGARWFYFLYFKLYFEDIPQLTNSTSNVLENARTREKLLLLLKDYDKFSSEVRDHRTTIAELDFLLKQVQKEIKGLKAKGTGSELEYAKTLTNQTVISQLENRLDTAMKKFNSVNSDNYKMRLEIDKLLRDRQFFNLIWRNQLKRLMDGKAQILELVEQAINAYDQREEWCTKLDALKEKAAIDYRKHCMASIMILIHKKITRTDKGTSDYTKLSFSTRFKTPLRHIVEVRELQRQLDHSMKLEEFLRTKGTVRLTAADAKAEAKRLEQQEEELRAYNNHVTILEAIKEFTGEDDVDKLITEFTRREEENYALFNYINEVNTELKNLSDNVKMLKDNIEEERAKHQAKMCKQQDSIESLKTSLEEKRATTVELQATRDRSSEVLANLLQQIQGLAVTADCNSLPLLKLLGKAFDVNVTNARLYIKSLEKKIMETVDIIRMDEALQRASESKERTPPSSRRRPKKILSNRQRPREPVSAHA
ncbi:unnamed protein product [Diatraea saccharalis]|uniref:ODAD1 central coiled coil region domain-containing protein n=1 Tax=Diatraea saccharalis TaxID=40085 RepID=A0A9N9R8I1_9NEOP|nr:unnamed protein product [Diatraea saccharalis]